MTARRLPASHPSRLMFALTLALLLYVGAFCCLRMRVTMFPGTEVRLYWLPESLSLAKRGPVCWFTYQDCCSRLFRPLEVIDNQINFR